MRAAGARDPATSTAIGLDRPQRDNSRRPACRKIGRCSAGAGDAAQNAQRRGRVRLGYPVVNRAFRSHVFDLAGARFGIAYGPGVSALNGGAITSAASIAAIGGIGVDMNAGVGSDIVGAGVSFLAGAGAGAGSMFTATGAFTIGNLRSAAGC